MSEHSKVPWNWILDPHSEGFRLLNADGDRVIFHSGNDDRIRAFPEDKALIAAAPELLAACKRALPSLHWANIHGSRCDDDIAAMKTAIAKAEGAHDKT